MLDFTGKPSGVAHASGLTSCTLLQSSGSKLSKVSMQHDNPRLQELRVSVDNRTFSGSSLWCALSAFDPAYGLAVSSLSYIMVRPHLPLCAQTISALACLMC